MFVAFVDVDYLSISGNKNTRNHAALAYQHKFKLGLQYLKMVNNYKYIRITTFTRLTPPPLVAETKRKVDSSFTMIKINKNLKIGINTKILMIL